MKAYDRAEIRNGILLNSCQAFLKMSRKTLIISPDLSGLLRFYEPYASNDETIDSMNPYLMFDRLEDRLRRDTYLCP